MLDRCRERNWLKARGRQRTDSTHVLARIRAINRLECVCETMRHTLNSLAVVVPEWLKSWTPPEWVDRYGWRIEDFRLPTGAEQRHQYAEQVGRDGYALLTAAFGPTAPSWLRSVPAVQTLRRVWVQQFHAQADRICWRTEEEGIPPSSAFISSPWRLDRLGRTAKGLLTLLEELQVLGVGFVSLREGFDLATPAGRLMAGVLASVAAYETEVRKERQLAGIAKAKTEGKRWGGRKTGTRVRLTEEKEDVIRQLHGQGKSVAFISRTVGLTRKTVYRALSREVATG